MSRGRSSSLSGGEPLGLGGGGGGIGGASGSRRAVSVDDDDAQIGAAARAAADTARYRLDRLERLDETFDDIEDRTSDAFRRVHLPPQIVAALHELENHEVVQAALEKMHRAYSYVEPVTGRILSRVGSLDETGSDVEFVIPPSMGGRSPSLVRSPSFVRASPRFGTPVNSLDHLIPHYHSNPTPPLIRVEAPHESDLYHHGHHYHPAPDQISLLSAADSERQYDVVRPNIFYRTPPTGPIPKHKKRRSYVVHQPSSSASAFTTLYNPYDYRPSKTQRLGDCDCVQPSIEDLRRRGINDDIRIERLGCSSKRDPGRSCFKDSTDPAYHRAGRRQLPQPPQKSRSLKLDNHHESSGRNCDPSSGSADTACDGRNKCKNENFSRDSRLCDTKCSNGGGGAEDSCNNDRLNNEGNEYCGRTAGDHQTPVRRQPSKLLRQTSVDIEGGQDSLDYNENDPLMPSRPKPLRLDQVKKLSNKEVTESYLKDKLDTMVCIKGKTYVMPQASIQSRGRNENECRGGASQFFENSQSVDWPAFKAGTFSDFFVICIQNDCLIYYIASIFIPDCVSLSLYT